MFCHYCMFCYSKDLITMTKTVEDAFIVNGFNNWKKARERFGRHQLGECHKEVQIKLRNLQAPSVAAPLVSQAQSAQSENRLMLLRQLSSLKFLLRQGMAIRGHKEGEGNLVQLMDLRSEDAPGLKRWLEKHQYMFHFVVNEMITLMGNTVLRKLLSNICEACWFTIIADETRDISNHEQLAIAILWVGSTYDIHEYFIGLVHVPSTTSATLTPLSHGPPTRVNKLGLNPDSTRVVVFTCAT